MLNYSGAVVQGAGRCDVDQMLSGKVGGGERMVK